MKVGDLVKPKSNQYSRWYGHPQAGSIVGLVLAVDVVGWKHPHYDIIWNANIFEPAAAGCGLEVISESR